MNRQTQLQAERDSYQRRIQLENIRNLQLQNNALSSSIRAMGGSVPGESVEISTGTYGNNYSQAPGGALGNRSVVGNYSQAFKQLRQIPGVSIGGSAQFGGSTNSPSFAEIQSMIQSSQQRAREDFRNQINLFSQSQAAERQRAQEDFRNQINLLQAQWQQKQEEKQVASPPTQEGVIEDLRNRIDLLQSQAEVERWQKQVAHPPTPPPPTPSNLSPVNDGSSTPPPSTPSNLSPVNDGSSTPPPSTPADNFPSLAEIQSLIESSQQKAQEDFTSKVNLLKTQQQQKQEEEQLSARNAATRMQNYQRQLVMGAWESALRGR